ncbi:MAG: hypothetical protein WD336_11000 [Trueperaceae bacterium]
MQRVLEMMWESLRLTWDTVVPALADAPVWAWVVIIMLIAAWIALRMLRPSHARGERTPELFLARAELVKEDHDGPFALLAGFSNLHAEPVQLLALAAAGGDGQRVLVEATALIAPQKAVELEADLDIGGSGKGWLELYLYVPSSRARAWRLRVPLAWEPWTQSFKAVPLEQSLTPVRKLPEPRGRPADPAATPPPDAMRQRSPRSFPDDF